MISNEARNYYSLTVEQLFIFGRHFQEFRALASPKRQVFGAWANRCQSLPLAEQERGSFANPSHQSLGARVTVEPVSRIS